MKPELPFSKLPALGELLKHPTVLGVVQRVNQTTVAQRAAGFWEELQSGWKEQGGLPSVGELAERLAQRLLGRSQHAAPTVNAAGVLCSRRWHAPLAETAVHELLRFASEYQQPSSELMDQVAASLVLSTRAEAAWVASSFEAALSMTNQCEGATLVSCPLMGLIDPADFGRMHVDTVADRFAAGGRLGCARWFWPARWSAMWYRCWLSTLCRAASAKRTRFGVGCRPDGVGCVGSDT